VVDCKTTCFLIHNHTITATIRRKTASHKYLFERVHSEHCTPDTLTVSFNHVTHILVLVFLQALSLVLAVV